MKIKILQFILRTFYKDTSIVMGVKWSYITGLKIKNKNVLIESSTLIGNKVYIKTKK